MAICNWAKTSRHQIIAQIEPVANTVPDPWLPIDARIYYDLETHNWLDAVWNGESLMPHGTAY